MAVYNRLVKRSFVFIISINLDFTDKWVRYERGNELMNKETVLLCDENTEWLCALSDFMSHSNFASVTCMTGKEVQKELYDNGEITTLIMNWETVNHSALEVLRYIKSMKPSLRVFLIFEKQNVLDESGLDKESLVRLGVTASLIKPFNNQKIIDHLKGGQKFDSWKDSSEQKGSEFKPEEIQADDREFTRIKIKDFASGARTVFDHYIKIGSKKYLKILHRGETFSVTRIEQYVEKDVDYLYFKSAQRTEYINYLNSLITKLATKAMVKSDVKLNMMKMGSEMLVAEIYTQGLSPALLKESKTITEGVQKTLRANNDIYNLLRNFVEEEPDAHTQGYLTSLFAGMICMQIPWAGKRTADIVGQASFLLDLGLLKIPPTERNIDQSKMKPDELKRFQSHPLLSVELLEQYNFITDAVKQVILDHHEYVNGEGYPKGISGGQIFPLAKIVCFASEFAEYILKGKLSPVDGMKELLAKKNLLNKYDAEIVKCFVSSLMQKELANKAG